jgi:DNA mismatch endonuclease (patch repair protein)
MKATTPDNNEAFWREKFRRNKLRDRRKITLLIKAGWKVLVVWECETGKLEKLRERLYNNLRSLG